ncbi:hypothetical protein U2075_14850, partial [Listeria monocytogenes]|uniref:hypothetical protein n=1 Tax=Listeria monocytogenes TaxID=1639 RepID=UPI002FDC46B6
LAQSGRFESVENNFYGSTSAKRMYVVDGKNRAMEISYPYIIPLDTGMTTDKPNHVASHKNMLWCSFPNGSLQNSSVGNPNIWS